MTEQQEVRVGTIKYTYRNGKVSSYMFDYVDEQVDEPAWYWRWNTSDQVSVAYMLEKYPELAETGEHMIY